MKNKLLIGALAVVAAAVVAVVINKSKTKYAKVQSSDTEEERAEDSEAKKKIAIAAKKMVEWIINHKDYIEAATLVVGLAAKVITLRNKVNEGRNVVNKTPINYPQMTGDEIFDHVRETGRTAVVTAADDGFKFTVIAGEE